MTDSIGDTGDIGDRQRFIVCVCVFVLFSGVGTHRVLGECALFQGSITHSRCAFFVLIHFALRSALGRPLSRTGGESRALVGETSVPEGG